MSDFKIVKLLNPTQINVTLKPRGAYDSGAVYAVGDSVSYNNSSYVAILAGVGNLPTDTTYWQLLAEGAAHGSLSDLSDVAVSDVLDRQQLIYDTNISSWTNHTPSKSDVGLSNVDNVSAADLRDRSTHTGTQLASTISDFDSAADLRVTDGISTHESAVDPHPQYETSAEAQAKVDAHANRVDNPHSVTQVQVGLGNVDNTSDLDKPISTATQGALDTKYDNTNPSGYVDAIEAATAAPVQSVAGRVGTVILTKSDVGLSNVDNVSAADLRNRSTHTGTQLASTISDFDSAAQVAIITQIIANNDTSHSPSSDVIHDALAAEETARIAIGDRVTDIENDYGAANGLATLDSAGKISSSMLPGTVLEYKGTWDASTNTPTLQDGSGANAAADAGHIYRVSIAGTVDFGNGSIIFYVGDDVILSESLIWQRSPGGSLVISVNGYQGAVTLSAEDIALTSVVAGASDVQHALENVYTSVSETMTSHIEDLDPHPQYETSAEAQAKVDAHANLTNNPHSVTKAQVGLGNVDNTSDANKPISTATQNALNLKYDSSNPASYVDASGAAAAAPVQSVAGKTGTVTLTKSDVGLSNVPNVDATLRSNHTGTQLASTISDFTEAAQDSVAAAVTDTATVAWTYLDSSNQLQANVPDGSISNTKLAIGIDAAKIDGGLVSNTQFNYLANVTSDIQGQLNSKRGLFNIQTITSGTAYTPSVDTIYIVAELIGAGGGGGGVSGAGASIGAGGGGGSGSKLVATVALTGAASYACTIGTLGAGGIAGNNPGTAGTSTTLTIGATTYTAPGGSGGTGQAAGTNVTLVAGGAGGTLPTGGALNLPGKTGGIGWRSSGAIGIAGAGADSALGGGGQPPTVAAAGNPGLGYGSGGSGGYSTAGTNRAGGNGAPGVIVIYEYK